MKKFIALVSAIAVSLAFVACGGASAPAAEKPAIVKKAPTFEVIEHKASGIGGDVPEWVSVYISDGNTGVEALTKFKDKYVFIGEDSGSNLPGLRIWAQNFNVAQEMAKLVSNRVQAKFAGAAAGSPDAEMGRYFENVVKSVSESNITGARKESDFWVYKRYFKADGKTEDKLQYDYYVLNTIDKASLKSQIDAALNGTKTAKPVTKEQQTAIDRVKESFYEGF